MSSIEVKGINELGRKVLVVDPDDVYKIYGLPPAEDILEYLLESQHNSWDGFPRHQVTGINAMVKDMLRYSEAKRDTPCATCDRPMRDHSETDYNEDGSCNHA